MRYPLVDDLAADGIPVAVTCRVLGFSKQAYYKWRQNPVPQRDWDDAHLIDAARDIHADDPDFGYRFIADELPEHGITAGENRVQRLCAVAGMEAIPSFVASNPELICRPMASLRGIACSPPSSSIGACRSRPSLVSCTCSSNPRRPNGPRKLTRDHLMVAGMPHRPAVVGPARALRAGLAAHCGSMTHDIAVRFLPPGRVEQSIRCSTTGDGVPD